MIAVAVIGVIAMIGLPGLKAMLENNRVATQTNRLVSAIHLARSEAVKRNKAVTLCPVGDGGGLCGDDWSKGWKVVIEGENRVLRVFDVKDQLLSVPSAPARLVFNAEGRVDATASAQREIIIRKASFQRRVALTLGGSVRSCRVKQDGACVER